MTVKEYREKKPNCKYCANAEDFLDIVVYCGAKEKCVFLNKAKNCEIYQAKEYKYDR